MTRAAVRSNHRVVVQRHGCGDVPRARSGDEGVAALLTLAEEQFLEKQVEILVVLPEFDRRLALVLDGLSPCWRASSAIAIGPCRPGRSRRGSLTRQRYRRFRRADREARRGPADCWSGAYPGAYHCGTRCIGKDQVDQRADRTAGQKTGAASADARSRTLRGCRESFTSAPTEGLARSGGAGGGGCVRPIRSLP